MGILKRFLNLYVQRTRVMEAQVKATQDVAAAILGRPLADDPDVQPEETTPKERIKFEEFLDAATWNGMPLDDRHRHFAADAWDALDRGQDETTYGEHPRTVMREFGVPDDCLPGHASGKGGEIGKAQLQGNRSGTETSLL